MKSLLAVLAMATALGSGYWKYNNPTAGLNTLKVQASQQMGGMASRLSGVSREQIQQVNDELEASRTRQQETQSELDSNKQSLEEATNRLGSAETRLTELLGIMNAQQSILAEQQKVNEQNTQRFNQMEEATRSLISPVAAAATPATTAADGTEATPGPDGAAGGQLAARMTSIEEQVSNLLGQVNGGDTSVAEQIETLSTRNAQERSDAMAELADALRNEQQDQLVEMRKSIESDRQQELTETTLAVREERQLAIEGNERELRQQMASLQNQFATLSAVSGDAQSAVTLTTNLDDRIAALENSIANLDDNAVLKRVESRISQQIVDANDKLATIQEQDERQTDNVNNRLTNIEQQIGDLDSNLTEKLTADTQTKNAQTDKSVEMLQAKVSELESRLTVSASQFKIITTRLDNLQRANSLQNTQAAIDSQRSQQNSQGQESGAGQQLAAATAQPEALENNLDDSVNRQSLARQDVSDGKAVEYKIYFAKDSVAISKAAEKVLKSFVAQEINRADRVSIFGFTDRSGNAAYNQRLALRRANRVRSYLIQEGFDFRKFNAVDGLGEDLAASKGDDGKEDANQRTVVMYAYQR